MQKHILPGSKRQRQEKLRLYCGCQINVFLLKGRIFTQTYNTALQVLKSEPHRPTYEYLFRSSFTVKCRANDSRSMLLGKSQQESKYIHKSETGAFSPLNFKTRTSSFRVFTKKRQNRMFWATLRLCLKTTK